MSKRTRTKQPGTSKDRSIAAADPRLEQFSKLLQEARERAASYNGALQVAVSVAAVSARVTVDASLRPFHYKPVNLFDRTFASIGIDAAGLRAFRAHLTAQLPEIAGDIAGLPEQPELEIGSVAQFIRVSLGASRKLGRAAEKRLTPSPGMTIVTRAPLRAAREQVRNSFGVDFASKATDALLLQLRQPAGDALRGLRAARGGTAPGIPGGLVLELATGVTASTREVLQSLQASKAIKAAADVLSEATSDRNIGTPEVVRAVQVSAVRERFLRGIYALTSHLEKRLPALPGREAASAGMRIGEMEVCWLNETIRTGLFPLEVGEVAGDPAVVLLDVPRRLKREVRVSTVTVRAKAFRKTTGLEGLGIVVAVIDSEVDVTHPALAGRVTHKANFTRERFGNPDTHGTAVAGIIGSADARFTGVAPGVLLLNYKVLASDERLDSDDFGGAMALQQALEDGAHIANCSWGAGPARDGTGREARACDAAWSLGMVIVKSAGNNGPGARTLTTPADADGVIVVGATDKSGRKAQPYSSRGPAGSKARPHVVAPGGSTLSGVETCLPGGGFGSAGMGTSFAAPHASGAAALLLGQDPHLTPDVLRQKLIASAKRLTNANQSTQGAGLIQL